MVSNYRISENSIPAEAPITLAENSKDIEFLDPRKYRLASSVKLSDYLSSNLLDSDSNYLGGNDGVSDGKTNDVPQLEDITVLENTTYTDSKGITRAKLVLRVRNSSGKNLLGVDARKAILVSEGGQS